MQMLDVSRENAVISLYAVYHSRDLRISAKGPVTREGQELSRVIVRAHTGNYAGSSKSMEAEGTIRMFEQLGKSGRNVITAFVADDDGGLRKLARNSEELVLC